MIQINKNTTTDSRSCDFIKVTKDTLRNSSIQHIEDVKKGIAFFNQLLHLAAEQHDFDKLTLLEEFHTDFVSGFKNTSWWDNHRKVNRHHLMQTDGVPEDVNLVDVLEMIVDCVMAGMASTGTVYPVDIDLNLLKKAFDNTVNLLKSEIAVEE